MVTMAQRIADLRGERGLSAPALSAALGFPRTAIDKFESGRQTPTQDQQSRMATYFGVTLAYLRGESGDRTETEDWMAGGIPDPEPVPAPRAERPVKPAKPSGEPGAVFGALVQSQKFQDTLHQAVLDVLRSPEGQEILSRMIRLELNKRK